MNLHSGTVAEGGIAVADGCIAVADGGIVTAVPDFAMLDFVVAAVVAVVADGQYCSYSSCITRTHGVAEDGNCSVPYVNNLAHAHSRLSHTGYTCQSLAFFLLLELRCCIWDISMFCGY